MNYKKKAKALIVTSYSDNKLEALEDIVFVRLVKRELRSKVLDEATVVDASGGDRRKEFKIVDYIESKEAKKIVAEIKAQKMKVNAVLEGDYIRVKGKNLDDLQSAMRHIRSMEWDAPLVFENCR